MKWAVKYGMTPAEAAISLKDHFRPFKSWCADICGSEAAVSKLTKNRLGQLATVIEYRQAQTEFEQANLHRSQKDFDNDRKHIHFIKSLRWILGKLADA